MQLPSPIAPWVGRVLGVAMFDLLIASLEIVASIPPAPFPLSSADTGFHDTFRPPGTHSHAVTCLQCLGELHIVRMQHAVALKCYVKSALVLRNIATDEAEVASVLTARNFPDGTLSLP